MIPGPMQRHRRAEHPPIKPGEPPPEWEQEPDKLAQKAVDARWTQKTDNSDYGSKHPINVDGAYGLMREHSITDAAVHDAQALAAVLDPDKTDDGVLVESFAVWAESKSVPIWV